MWTYVCTFFGLQGRIRELEQREGDHVALQQRFESLNRRYIDLQALNSHREARTKGQHSQNAQQSAGPAGEEDRGEDEDEDEDEGEEEGEGEDSSDDQGDGACLVISFTMLFICM